MGSFGVRVGRAPPGSALAGRPEHCSADPDRLAAAGAAVGMQVRLTRPGGELALFTVSEAAPGDGTVVLMELLGDRNWWPPRGLARVLPAVRTEGRVPPGRGAA